MNRLLGPSEFQLWLLDRHSPYNAAVVGRLRGSVSPEAVRAALDAAQARHPILRTRLLAEPRPRWEGDDAGPIPLRWVDGAEDDAWRRELALEVRQPTDLERGPLARAVVVRGADGSDLLVAMPHQAADGHSLIFLLRDLLRALAGRPWSPSPSGRVARSSSLQTPTRTVRRQI